jgi:antitoxin component of RelBE/YafQ-DinJ toxin-antitoxin module
MDSLNFHLRIDRAIAEKAMKMAHARGMELPDVIRMMLAKAVRLGDFSIDEDRPQVHQVAESTRPYFAYDERQWDTMKSVLDAELALALLDQYIAAHTLRIEDLAAAAEPDAGEIARLKQEREDARNILATVDPIDANAIRDILARFGAPRDADPAEDQA